MQESICRFCMFNARKRLQEWRIDRDGDSAVMIGGPSFVGSDYLPTSDRRKNSRFAGRSAIRRIRYGYHAEPNGMYTRTR